MDAVLGLRAKGEIGKEDKEVILHICFVGSAFTHTRTYIYIDIYIYPPAFPFFQVGRSRAASAAASLRALTAALDTFDNPPPGTMASFRCCCFY